MRVIVLGLLTFLLGSCGLFMDERYEGSTDDCTNNHPDWDVLLLLDAPTSPVPSGYLGVASTSADDTWTLAPIEDAQNTPTGLTFKAKFDLGSDIMRVEVTLDRGPDGTLKGDWEHDTNGTVKCDVELEAK
ncbi:MAG: hypothetical protein AB2A00_37085 [Myxococcota bacterium]